MEHIDVSGFEVEADSSYHKPLYLNCFVADEKPGPQNKEKVAFGQSLTDRRYLEKDKIYQFWVMYGKDKSGKNNLYFKEEGDAQAFKLIRGNLRFVFDADAFAHLAINAKEETLNYFLSRTSSLSSHSATRFLRLLEENVSALKKASVMSMLYKVVDQKL